MAIHTDRNNKLVRALNQSNKKRSIGIVETEEDTPIVGLIEGGDWSWSASDLEDGREVAGNVPVEVIDKDIPGGIRVSVTAIALDKTDLSVDLYGK